MSSKPGACHYRRYRVVNFDLNEGRQLQLADLFKSNTDYLDRITAYSDQQLARKLHHKSTQDLTLTADSLVNWNINIHGLRVTFDEEIIAPVQQGSQSVLIPYSKLEKLMNPESSLGRCLKHRTSCMREHLLTGGFIDEAANTRHSRLNPAFS